MPPASSIQINGQPHALGGPAPLPELLATLGLAGKPVVIELDGKALPASVHDATTIHPGATLEIVTLAAGG